MHRIDSATAEADTNGAGKDGFTDGTPPSIPPTDLTAKFFNAVQEEIAVTVTTSGRTLSDVDHNQLVASVVLRDTDSHGFVTATGSNKTGLTGTGHGSGAGLAGVGGATAGAIGVNGTGGSTSGAGVKGTGTGNGVGLWGVGGPTAGAGIEGDGTQAGSYGVYGVGGPTSGPGVRGEGTGSGAGVSGVGGATSGAIGVNGTGGSTDGVGVKGTGVGSGAGGSFSSPTGYGVDVTAGGIRVVETVGRCLDATTSAASTISVYGKSSHASSGTGVFGEGASASIGVHGETVSGKGVDAYASGSGTGVYTSSSSGVALHVSGNTTLSPIRFDTQAAVPTGASLVGDLYMTNAGVLKVCTGAGTGGGATWVSVGSQA